MERRELARHPPINLVVRLGDPESAVAFASAHDTGSVASVALSALLLARLHAHGIDDVSSVPTGGGLSLSALCADTASARAFSEQVTAALATPVAEGDVAVPAIQAALAALRAHRFLGQAESAVASCSQALGILPGTDLPDLRSAAGRAEIDAYRRFAFSVSASSFAAVGSAEFVDGAASELGHVADWPSGDAPEDPWPASEGLAVDGVDGPRRLSVALRVADAERALSALTALSSNDADLGRRLRTFLPGFSVQSVTSATRPRGACVRVDLALSDGDPGPTLNEATQGVSIVSDELRAAVALEPSQATLDENTVQPNDPREAAARAAWRALTGRSAAGPERRAVALSVHPVERATFNGWDNALSDFENRPLRAPIETRSRVEPGQGELWLLVGSPCGTLGESNEDAGQTALTLALAAQTSRSDVAFEPWFTADAIGLLAHSPRRSRETASQQAERVARALARSLSERDASGNALAGAQSALFEAIGGEPRPGFARLLDALSPDHVAWLEPRGTWASLTQLSGDGVRARGRDLLRGPLRLAVIANDDETQAKTALHAFERWLAPWRDDPRRCQATAEQSSHGGEITLALAGDSSAESAYVAVPFRSRLKYDREAEALADFLNGPRGALASALGAGQVSASARATVVGGDRVAALTVEIHASDDEARRATLEVRRALERLAGSALSSQELADAQRASARRTLAASLDPRRRIVDLWRGAHAPSPLTADSLRAFQATLNTAAQVVVFVTHKD